MPIYKYTCQACKRTVEALIKISDKDSPLKCPCEGTLIRDKSMPNNIEYKGAREPGVQIIDERGR
jgi:putative FmdB family regulatory protein